MAEKKRYFLWLVEAALFIAWYKLIGEYNFTTIFIIIMGIILSMLFFYTLKRGRESMLLTEKELRDIECKFRDFTDIKFDKFNNDMMAVWEKQEISFECSGEKFDKKELTDYWEQLFSIGQGFKCINRILLKINRVLDSKIPIKWQSERFCLDFLSPILFMLSWFILLLVTIYNLYN